MQLDVISLALLAAILWGIYPIILKRGFEDGGNPLQATMTTILVGNLLLWSGLVAYHGPINLINRIDMYIAAVFLLSGFVGSVIGRLANYAGVNRIGASITSAGTATNPVFASIFAFIGLNEAVTVPEFIGMLVAVWGLVILSISKGGDIGGWKKIELLFPLVGAIAYGASHTLRRHGLTATHATAIEGVALNELAALFGLTAYLLVRYGSFSKLVGPRSSYKFFVLSGTLGLVALVTFFEALSRGRVIIVVTLAATSSLWAVIFASVLLKGIERVNRKVLVGASFVVVGVAIINVF